MNHRHLLVPILSLALAGCAPRRLDVAKLAAREQKQLDRQAAKAKEARPGNWGFFSGEIDARWEEDGLTMVLLSELRYTDPYGVVWTAPAGSRVNGASIPRAFWSIIGGPFEGKYRKASVLHDVAYDRQDRPPEEVDLMFYNAMRASGVGIVTAKTMYYALLRHGRHWKHRQAIAVDSDPDRRTEVRPGEMNEIQSWIRSNDPDLTQIRGRAQGTPR